METETNHYAERLAAFDEAQAALAATPTAELLTAAYALTHRIHVAEGRGKRTRPCTEAEVRDLRQQRDMVTAEVLRRTEGHSLRAVK